MLSAGVAAVTNASATTLCGTPAWLSSGSTSAVFSSGSGSWPLRGGAGAVVAHAVSARTSANVVRRDVTDPPEDGMQTSTFYGVIVTVSLHLAPIPRLAEVQFRCHVSAIPATYKSRL